MAICRSCNNYYKQSKFNTTDECEDCAFTLDSPVFDEEDTLEVEHLLNPTGKVQPKFYE